MRPAGTEGWSEDKLATLVTRDLHDRHRPAEDPGGGRVMDGIHDMGGMHGFGKVEPEQNEPVFHAAWEGRCLALNRAMGATGAWTIDEARAGIEQLPPQVYLAHSYYGKWALRPGKHGHQPRARRRRRDCRRAMRCARPSRSRASSTSPTCRGADPRLVRPAPPAPARFKVGERVRTKNIHPATHTRLPRYARGQRRHDRSDARLPRFPESIAVGAARIRNGSTPWCSTAASCGARTPTRH